MAPRVSVVIPARNEAAHIEACVHSVVGQRFEGGIEVIVVDGASEDATARLAEVAGAVVVPNPERTIPTALNIGLARAQGQVFVRFDAHAEMPPGYVEACLRALAEESAANVGGWRKPAGTGPWGRSIGAALASPLGVGNARLWRRPPAGEPRREVQTIPLGCFPIEVLRAVGGWREEVLTNEDFELNHRLREHGGRVVFAPEVWSIYRPRETYRELVAQYWRYGRWKAVVLFEQPESLRPRQLAPLGLLVGTVAAVVPSPLARPARLALTVYGLTLGVAAGRSGAGWRLAATLATMHGAWGAAVAVGLASGGRPPR